MNNINQNNPCDVIREYSYKTVGPVAYEYTVWVLNELKKRGIKTAYFLARDGYLLYQIANELCKNEFSEIEPKYLFCSRLSLRTPTYHLIGEEAFKLLTLDGYYVTPRALLSRPLLSNATQEKLLQELEIRDADKPMTREELALLCNSLLNSAVYRQAVIEVSKKAYGPAIQYFKEMGVLDTDKLAIIDSGWSGSMQRSLRQLIESAGYTGKIYGFYFGMYESPKEACDGEYNTFYFNKKNGLLRKVNFNNNLFECMLSADHPMTVGYEIHNGASRPVFAPEPNPEMTELIKAQLEGALRYAKENARGSVSVDKRAALKKCYQILKRAMTTPSRVEAETYSHFMFCDDVTEGYVLSLSPPDAERKLKEYVFIRRILKRFFKKEKPCDTNLIWVHGVIAYCRPIKRVWYRLNIFLWNFIKYLK